ncbi:acetolactate decarboxylase [Apibacter raozihei]|uniref:acetolactate decarboxylase n=1 Tax=Apibacter raozihei TaxID=2500547 RepID=UPI000FE2BCAD|nr:acetolactate decarboxylase [Apibacter raozihei]
MDTKSKKQVLYQFSTINALMSGIIKGNFKAKDVLACGNFGLGCSDGMSGEIIIDGEMLEGKDNHELRELKNTDLLPFAQITTFNPEKSFQATHLNKSNLHEKLSQNVLLDNVFLAVKIVATFNKVVIRTPKDGGENYKDGSEFAHNQLVRTFENSRGILIGFWSPEFFENVSVAGFHLHYVSEDKKVGGHVFEFDCLEAEVFYETKFNLSLKLFNTEEYLKKDLDNDKMMEMVKNVEK